MYVNPTFTGNTSSGALASKLKLTKAHFCTKDYTETIPGSAEKSYLSSNVDIVMYLERLHIPNNSNGSYHHNRHVVELQRPCLMFAYCFD